MQQATTRASCFCVKPSMVQHSPAEQTRQRRAESPSCAPGTSARAQVREFAGLDTY